MRSTCEPSVLVSNTTSGLPPVLAIAAAWLGYNVRDMIGRPLLNSNCCVQKPEQVAFGLPLVASYEDGGFVVGQFVPAKLNAVWPPPVIGSFGSLVAFESCRSIPSLKLS